MSLEEILKIAKEAGASDVHITVGVPPKMRVNGELLSIGERTLTPEETKGLLYGIMSDSQKEKLDKRGACDLSFSIAGQGRYRVNGYMQRGSVAMALRLVGWDIPTPESLGVPDALINLYKKKKGLILVTGPNGSGKSNTLASFIGAVNANRSCHVITLEDPIEFLHQHKKAVVNQREIGLDAESYSVAMKDALRENPDVIMVGEIRDYDDVAMAVTAAETGRLVIATMHTKDVVTTIERMLDVFPAEKQQQIRIQLSNNLRAVVSQQLLPSIDGGLVAAFEVLIADDAIKKLVREGNTHEILSAVKMGKNKGMTTMDDAIMQLFYDGKIDRDVAVSFAHEPELMENRI